MSKSSQAFRTIREVADWLDVAAHVLRFWESKFPQIKPVKRAGGRRYYRPSDMEFVGGIKVLLHDRGMTIRGVQKLIREEGASAIAALSPPLDTEDSVDATGTDDASVWAADAVTEANSDRDAPSQAALPFLIPTRTQEEQERGQETDVEDAEIVPEPEPALESDVAAMTAPLPAQEPAVSETTPETADPVATEAPPPSLEPVKPFSPLQEKPRSADESLRALRSLIDRLGDTAETRASFQAALPEVRRLLDRLREDVEPPGA